MDPQACIVRFHSALLNGELSEAVQAMADYYQWRIKGGHNPVNCSVDGRPNRNGDSFAATFAAELADKLNEPCESQDNSVQAVIALWEDYQNGECEADAMNAAIRQLGKSPVGADVRSMRTAAHFTRMLRTQVLTAMDAFEGVPDSLEREAVLATYVKATATLMGPQDFTG